MAFFPPGLVWLASYPKSGNTWMRVLLANLLAGKEQPVNINHLSEPETLMGNWRFSDDMLVDPDLLHWQELEQMRPLHCDFVANSTAFPFFCKTHDHFRGVLGRPILGTRARGALYILRDPRDVAVSLSHHANLPLDAVIAQMGDPFFSGGNYKQLRYLLGDWAGHVSQWTGQRLVKTKVVRYEDLRKDAVGILCEIVAFLDGKATRAEIERAVAYSSLDELQRQETSSGFRESQPGQKRFFRSGHVGGWRAVLTPQQVRAIEKQCAAVMAEWSYQQEG